MRDRLVSKADKDREGKLNAAIVVCSNSRKSKTFYRKHCIRAHNEKPAESPPGCLAVTTTSNPIQNPTGNGTVGLRLP